MPRLPKTAALSAGLLGALSLATLAQQPARTAQVQAARAQDGETLVLSGQIDWLDKSDISALREGVIKKIEFTVGDRVKAGAEIGRLHDESAGLMVAKAKVAATSSGAIEKSKASRLVALTQLAILDNLRKKGTGMVTLEEYKKAEAEVIAATAAVQETEEQRKLAEAELAIAQQALNEHAIIAPFTGYITDRMKGPEEAVRASEPILRLVGTDKLRFFGYLPLESAVRVPEGALVEVRPIIDDAELPIEQMRFKGKVKRLSREISTIGKTEIQVLAEIDNSAGDTNTLGSELLKGMKAEMTIFLPRQAPAAVGARTAAPATR